MKKTLRFLSFLLIFALLLSFTSCLPDDEVTTEVTTSGEPATTLPDPDDGPYVDDPFFMSSGIPPYANKPFVHLGEGIPTFTDAELTTDSYEFYSDLDSLGRCGMVKACVGLDLMPTEPRESISSVYPSGWKNKQYDSSLVDGGWLYNRCHLIGFQLSGENANEKNLITGTRYFNVDGMLPFENQIADYVKETGNHVLFRVTPLYYGNELVARGVRMEAYSVEDRGEGICFHVFVYNVQPGIWISYADGSSGLSGDKPSNDTTTEVSQRYILNTNTKRFHLPTCSGASSISPANRQEYTGYRSDLIAQNYSPCGTCDP